MTSSAGPRYELAAALMTAGAAAGVVGLTVWAAEHGTPPASPALVIRPGIPYRSEAYPDGGPVCVERWRLEILALVAIDVVAPLDELDALVELARDVIRATPAATYNGVKQAPTTIALGAKSYHGAIVELDVNV